MASDSELEAATTEIMRACGQVTAFTILVTMAPNAQEKHTVIQLLKASLDQVVEAVDKHRAVLTGGIPEGAMSNIVGRA